MSVTQASNAPEHDLDAGMQPEDINSIGPKRSGIPPRMIVAMVLIAVVLILLAAMGVKYLLLPRLAGSLNPAPKQHSDERPSKGTASLPGSNTPLGFPDPSIDEPSDDMAQRKSSRWPTNAAGAGTATGAPNTPASPSQAASARAPVSAARAKNTDCPVREVMDRQTGLTVKDAQGRVLKVDCHGTLQDSASASAGAGARATATATGSSVQVVPAVVAQPGANSGLQAEREKDRYGGDSTLSMNKKPSAPPGFAGMSPMPGLPNALNPTGAAQMVPGVSPGMSPGMSPSAMMMDAFMKNMAGNATRPAPTAAPINPANPVPPALNALNAGGGAGGGAGAAPNTQGAVGGMLTPSSTPKALAVRSINPSLTIPKGDAIDCAMTTRVVTEISGFTSCQITSNVYSADGKVLLIERMAEVEGEYAAVGAPGQRRVYVLWSRIRKPGGVTIDIASPSTDQLGAAGIDGIVDNRWFERIGSAYMLSIFKDFLTAQATPSGGNGTLIFQNSLQTSNSLAEKILAQSINIKPVVYAQQGDRVAIYVARDLDFTNVYTVKAVK